MKGFKYSFLVVQLTPQMKSLIQFIVDTHNMFLSDVSSCLPERFKPTQINLENVHEGHMISCSFNESKIKYAIGSFCKFTLEYGKGDSIAFDLKDIEVNRTYE